MPRIQGLHNKDLNDFFATETNDSWCKHKVLSTSTQENFSMPYSSPLSQGVWMQSLLPSIFRIQRSRTSFIIPLFDELRYRGPWKY